MPKVVIVASGSYCWWYSIPSFRGHGVMRSVPCFIGLKGVWTLSKTADLMFDLVLKKVSFFFSAPSILFLHDHVSIRWHQLWCRTGERLRALNVTRHWLVFCRFRYLVSQGVIKPLCDLLTVMDSKIVQVALSGLENILRIGKQDAYQMDGVNQFAVMVEEAYGELKVFMVSRVHYTRRILWVFNEFE